MVATKNGHEKIVRYLVKHGFNAHYQKKVRKPIDKLIIYHYDNHIIQDGVTALHVGSFKGRNEIVRYLCLEEKLDPNTPDQVNIVAIATLNCSEFTVDNNSRLTKTVNNQHLKISLMYSREHDKVLL